jgi:hypothetical protein
MNRSGLPGHVEGALLRGWICAGRTIEPASAGIDETGPRHFCENWKELVEKPCIDVTHIIREVGSRMDDAFDLR